MGINKCNSEVEGLVRIMYIIISLSSSGSEQQYHKIPVETQYAKIITCQNGNSIITFLTFISFHTAYPSLECSFTAFLHTQ